MTAPSYTDAGTLADYYRQLHTHSVRDGELLKDLYHWIDTGQIILDPPLKRPYQLCPRPYAYLVIQTEEGPRESYDFRVSIPAIELESTIKSYPPPKKPPIFVKPTVEPPAGKPMTFAQARAAKKAATDASKAQKAEREARALKRLRTGNLKAKGRKFCERLCRDEFNVGPQGFKRIWDVLLGKKPIPPKSRRAASKRRTRKS
jgi:hypothetical protein